MSRSSKSITMQDDTTDVLDISITRLFDEYKHVLKLKLPKQKAIIDLVATIPMRVTSAAKPSNIQQGFIDDDMLDIETKTIPDFKKMLATCKRNVSVEEYEPCVNTAVELFQIASEHGAISEADFDRLGYPLLCQLSSSWLRPR
jgi:hypothetical protein